MPGKPLLLPNDVIFLLHVSFVPFIYRTSAPLRVHRCNRRPYSTIYDYGAITGARFALQCFFIDTVKYFAGISRVAEGNFTNSSTICVRVHKHGKELLRTFAK